MYFEDANIRRTVAHLLYEMANADAVILPEEESYLDKVFKEIGVSEEEMQALENGTLEFDFKLPHEERLRIKILFHLLFLSRADNDISPEEVDYVRSLSIRLGIREMLVVDLTKVMRDHIGRFMHPDKLLDVLKKYFN